MKDLVGKQIVPVTAGGGVYRFVTQWQQENPGYKIDITASSAGIPYPDRLKEVQNGKYDALVLPSNLGQQTVIENQKLDIKASEPVSINNTYILIHRSDENKASGRRREQGAQGAEGRWHAGQGLAEVVRRGHHDLHEVAEAP